MRFERSFRAVTLRLVVAAMLVALVTITLPHLSAQSMLTGDVVGTVTDPSGAVVSNATATLSSADTGITLTATTSSTGSFRFPLVKPGQYKLTVTAKGFRTTTETVTSAVSAVTTANVQMLLGQSTETVEVSGAAPLLETENANITTTVNSTQVENLPNGGNDITAFAYSTPGVLMNTSSGGGYGNFTAFGLPATSNLFTVNGNDEMDPYLNLNNSGATNLLLGAAEVEEVGVTANGYTGQYGRMAGAQVNYSTKSGTNNVHGALKYYYNDVSMNGADWFLNNTNTKPGFDVNNQYAAQIGAPIVKDKLFFFVGTEGLRYVLSTSNPIQIPTSGFESNVLADLANPAVDNLPNSVPFYQQMFTLFDNAPGSAAGVPIGGAGGCGDLDGATINGTLYGTGGTPCAKAYRSTVGAVSTEWLMYTKLDWVHTNNDRWSARMKNDHGVQPTYTDYLTPAFSATSIQPAWEGQLSNTHTFGPSVINQFIGSVFWYSAIFQQSNAALASSTLPYAVYDLTGNWGNLAAGTLLGGEQNVFPQGRNVTTYQLVDDVSVTKGSHFLKFGANFKRADITDATFGVRTIPRARIFALGDFTNGFIDQFSQRFPQNLEERINTYSLGFYGQDEWRVNQKLKLTLTLRLDRNSNATCPGKCFTRLAQPFAQLDHTDTIPYNQMMRTGLSTAFDSVQPINVQPRFGFAYNLMKNTVVRGGAGMFSDLYPATLVDSYAAQAPFDPTFTISGLLSPAEGAASAGGTASGCNTAFQSNFTAGGTRTDYLSAAPGGCTTPDFHDVVSHLKNPTYLEWNLEVQHSIGNRSTISVNYVGNHGYNEFVYNDLTNSRDTNLFGNPIPAGQPSPSGLPAAYPDLRIRNLQSLSNGSTSNYNGLTASFTEQAAHGLQFSVAYTYSHALDSMSNGGVLPYSFNDSLGAVSNPYNLKTLNYSNGDNDVRHNINANYVWQIPTHYQGLMNQILGGWTLSGTVFARSGYPFTMFDTDLAGVFGNSTGFAVGYSPLPTFVGSSIPNCTGHDQNTGCFGASPDLAFQSGFGGAGPVWDGTFGHTRRNTFRGPHYFNSDFSVMKNFKVTERIAFGLGANMYNVFNHPNFGNPFHDIAAGDLAGKAYTTVEPATSPYGAFVGAAASGRIIQLHANLNF
jgi:hypothetical protein